MPDTTVAALIREVEAYLYSNTRPDRDKLASGITAGATTLTTTYSRPGIKTGAKLSIDLEDFYVWTASGATVTVQPADGGSTAAAHAGGANIIINAEYTPFEIFREINNELAALSAAGLYKIATKTLVFNPTYTGYDLAGVTNVDGIISVLAETSGADRLRVPVAYRLERNLDTDVFTSGFGVFVNEGWSGRDLFVAYRDQFTPVAALTDNVSAVSGLPWSAHDVLAMGAAMRLAGVAEIDRNQLSAQGSSRRANEVPAGSRLNAVRGLGATYQRRLVQEADRLKRLYPTRLVRRF